VLDADPDAPGDAGLRVRGAFRLPGAGGRTAAVTEDWFTGFVLRPPGVARSRPVRAEPPHDGFGDAPVRITRQRRALAGARARRTAPHGAGPQLPAQLVHLLGPAPRPAGGGEAPGRPGP
jgi:hypothetical protein